MVKRDMTHISLHFDSAVAKAVRIQAITEGVSLQAWITEAIMRQLAVAGQEPEPPQGKTA